MTAPLHALLEPLLARDPGGRAWLGPLLRAAPGAAARLGELADDPGYLETLLGVRTESGELGCFAYPSAPARELLRWYVDHPAELVRPAEHAAASPETRTLRRALLDDDPPGARARARDRAHDLLRSGAPRTATWWRFEEPGRLDGALLTERLVLTVTVLGPDGLVPATPWYPRRAALVRDLEAGMRLAGGRACAALAIADAAPQRLVDRRAVAALVADATPHLASEQRDGLVDAFLGCVGWADLRRALGG